MRGPATTTVAVLEALRDARVDGKIIRLPRWVGTEAAQIVDSILKGAGGSWDAEINGYRFPTRAVSVLQRIPEGAPRPTSKHLVTSETPEALAERMCDWPP